jgi:hypothetical protein
VGLPKPVIPEPVPQEAISEEFNQLNVQDDPKNETFDKDDESTQDEQIPEGTRIKTPTFNFRENVDEAGRVKTPTFNFRDIVDEGGFKTPTIIISHPPERMSVKLTPKVFKDGFEIFFCTHILLFRSVLGHKLPKFKFEKAWYICF